MRYFFKIFLWCTALWLAVSAAEPVVAWAEADAVAHVAVSGAARTAACGVAEGEASRVFEGEASRGEEQDFEPAEQQAAHSTGQDKPVIFLKKTERLNESRILARGVRGFRGLLPHYGLPEYGASVSSGGVLPTNVLCDEMAGAAISQEKGVWTSMNMDLKIPNWVAWDLNLAASGADRDPFMAKMPAGTVRLPQHLWRMILDECYRFAFDKALSPVTIVCGPLVSVGKNEPYEFFVVVCKKVRGGLGWQSMGFLLPNTANLQAAGGLFKYSVSVNMVEYKSGFDFFKRLPFHLEELIEEMTTYELFCPYIEDENYLDDPFESIDFRELMNDSLEDIRDSY